MTALNRMLSVALVFIVSAAAVTHAQDKSAKTQLVVLSTSVDRVSDALTIHGIAFGARPPQVWCETYPMTVLSATDTDIVVYLPPAVHDGTYRLTVLRSGPQSENGLGVFNMTVQTLKEGPRGATGPKGDTGETGAKGDTGAVGATGDTGATGATGAKGDAGVEIGRAHV